LNSATGYITPKDVLAGRRQEIHAERDHKQSDFCAQPGLFPFSQQRCESDTDQQSFR